MTAARRAHAVGLTLIVAGMALLSWPDRKLEVRPRARAGQYCTKAEVGLHILGAAGVELVCRPAGSRHRWRRE